MTWTTVEHKLKQLCTGEHLCVRTHTVRGKKTGPHVHIQASIHGAELQGNAVILALMEELKEYELKGSITFVPLCNHYASIQKIGTSTYGRFNPVTGHNWNRNFVDVIDYVRNDFERFVAAHKDAAWPTIKANFKRFLYDALVTLDEDFRLDGKISDNNYVNIFLQTLASQADVVLDFHTGPVAIRYLYCAEYEQHMAHHLLFDHVLVIPNKFAGSMDEASFMPWIYLCEALEKTGRRVSPDIYAFTLEFGSEEVFSLKDAQHDIQGVINFLATIGVIEKDVHSQNHAWCFLNDFRTIYAPFGGLCEYLVAPGEKFKANDILAFIYTFNSLDPEEPISSTRKPVIAPTDGIVINRCPSSAIHQGMELYQIMVNVAASSPNH